MTILMTSRIWCIWQFKNSCSLDPSECKDHLKITVCYLPLTSMGCLEKWTGWNCHDPQNSRLTEAGRDIWKSPCPHPPAPEGSPRTSYPGPHPGCCWKSTWEAPQPPWATCSSPQLPSWWQTVSQCSEGTSCHWVLWHRSPLCNLPSGTWQY